MAYFRHLRWQFILVLLLAGLSFHSASATGGVTLTVDANATTRHTISPLIYGMNFADPTLAAELKLPVDRWGGNATTRYNWQWDIANHASDWFFENIPNANSNPGALPNGSASDQFVDQDRSTGTQSIITMPLIGWTPIGNRIYMCGFSVAKYGPQQIIDSPYHSDCGNGVKAGGGNVTGNSPTDTSVAIGPSFDAAWIAHLITRYGTAANGGVQFYALDNEPMLWNSTHRDVHPNPTSYDEMKNRAYLYAPAIKAADPSAKIIGPELWGWTAYFYSALDESTGNGWWNNPIDRNAHGGTPFLDWYLQQMQAYQTAHGTRVLDYLDLHFYPQANGVSLSPAGDANTQALRLRSTRALWDPTYVDESWINDTVRLIPRMHDWVNNDYPGTKLSISEYNWGGLEDINGALAQADVLGIFGREGLDMATIWGPPSSTQPGAYAFRMYRNYDGTGSQFGDSGVAASSSDQSQLAVYGAVRSGDGALTLMIINKTGSDLTSALNLSNFVTSSTARVYRYSAANLNAIVRQSDQAVTAAGFSATYPANSITLVVIPPGVAAAKIDSIGIYRSGTFYLRLHNSTGVADLTVGFTAGTKPYPVVGDWTGAGFDTVGVFDQSNGQFSLRNSNAAGAPNEQFVLGNPNDQPLSGRWSLGASSAGAGVFRPSNGLIYLKTALSTGYANFTMVLGIPGDVGLAGDWNGKGFDSPGVYRPNNSTFYLSNQVKNGSVFGDYQVGYGLGGDAPVVGDWVAQGHDGIGLFRQSNGYTYLKNALTTGYADNAFTYGVAGDIPVAGHWQSTYPPIAPAPVLITKTAVPGQSTSSVSGGNLLGD